MQDIGEEKKQSLVEKIVTDTLKSDDAKYLYISLTLMCMGAALYMSKGVLDKFKK